MRTGKMFLWLLMVAAFGNTNVYSTPILDQAFDPSDNYNLSSDVRGVVDKAQTFTVGITGVLTRVDALIYRRFNTSVDLLFDIRRTNAGVPTESDDDTLASLAVPASSVPTTIQFCTFDISSFYVSVTVGDVLAIVFRTPPGAGINETYSWVGLLGDPYSPGSPFFRNPSAGFDNWSVLFGDSGFRTFVETIPEPADLSLDIKPGGCPNPLNTNTKGKGKLPVAILGTETFDVSEIDVNTISIADVVFPAKTPKIVDVATPLIDGEECECHELEGDGYADLVIHFSRREIILSLGLNQMERKSVVPITVQGKLLDGTPFEATDCVKIVGRAD
ncbi:MAG: hypothetical protein ACYTF1_23560, partial [Planctomycetota bacterium]|jgi:hypothetical protein